MNDATTPHGEPNTLFARFAIAAWGTCVGIVVATLVTAALIMIRGDAHDQPHPAILPSDAMQVYVVVPWQEQYEHRWYALVCVAGALGAWSAVRFTRVSPWLAMVTSILFVPLALRACRSTFHAHPSLARLLGVLALLTLPLVWRFVVQLTKNGPQKNAAIDASHSSGRLTAVIANQSPARKWRTTAILCFPLAALLIGLLAPYDLQTIASECHTESHVASYIVGPAQYYRAPDVVPGLDFESHYGIGHAYAFSFQIGAGGLQQTLEQYVLFVLTVVVLYFLSAFLVLTDWFQNPWAALWVTLALVLTCCDGLSYNYPSNWPVRHPFLFVFLFAAVRGIGQTWWCAAAGAVAGLSLFWQTDIGLYTFAAGLLFFVANWLFLGGSVVRPLVFLAAGAGSFFAICTVLFGPRVLSLTFLQRLAEPLLLYANGFGTTLMNWNQGWSCWYNLAGPGVAIASVGVMIGYGRRMESPPLGVLYAALASLLGLAMLFKWVNRSIDILWGLNGGLVVAVAWWWAWVGWCALRNRLAEGAHPRLAVARQSIAVAVLLALAVFAVRIDARAATSKHPCGNSSWLVRMRGWVVNYRNPINAARRGLEPSPRFLPLDDNETQYIRDHSGKNDRVAVICGNEWSYLVDAGRAPRLYWLQLYLVHSPILLERCANDLRNAEQVFVDRLSYSLLKDSNPTAYKAISQALTERFELAESSETRWDLYRRKPGAITMRQ